MSEFPRQAHEFLIPEGTMNMLIDFPSSSSGYPRLKPEVVKHILQELQKSYPSFKTYHKDEGAIGWFESDKPYIGIAMSILEFTFTYFDPLGPELLDTRKRLRIDRLNQQDLAYLISKNSKWKEKAMKETLRRMCFSVETSIKHRNKLANDFLNILLKV